MAPAAVGSSEPPHGQKRPAEDELEGEQPLTKKLGRLQIEPLARHELASTQHNGTSSPRNASNENAQAQLSGDGDVMQVDDTKTRVFIPDLDSEIAEIESREFDERNKIEFITEIDRKINGLPKRLLAGNAKSATDDNQQLVLYRVPTSLSIPQEQDSVRRAMVEARRRTKEKQAPETSTIETASDEGAPLRLPWSTSGTQPNNITGAVEEEDDDAMDID